ncbi:DUF5615 family PIN-like protein [Salaquimonas pukyongi]|uniref:DUF5615 family PIN-like protein n=1 Tax=Salaquimonas pukyongi TaxID=2712698 RepID=UPI00096B7AC4|nr:DUF5615 family PIN-like protein [Salaquimonas pukyongi]
MLLLDQNLPWRLVGHLSDRFPATVHVNDVGLSRASDIEIWKYARKRKLCITSKDADFRQMSFLNGAPPKVLWLNCGNSSTEEIKELLDRNVQLISVFLEDKTSSFLMLTQD